MSDLPIGIWLLLAAVALLLLRLIFGGSRGKPVWEAPPGTVFVCQESYSDPGTSWDAPVFRTTDPEVVKRFVRQPKRLGYRRNVRVLSPEESKRVIAEALKPKKVDLRHF